MTRNIDGRRLYASLQELAKIGAYKDEATGLIGVNRLALTAADGEGRHLVVKWFKEAGLKVTVDKIGNVYARREGGDPELEPVMLGSHIDSVPTAGAFDGCLGVLGALEVVRTLNDNKIGTARPLVVAFFTEEEGCRFGTDMLGSATATGRLSLKQAYELKDRDGLMVKDELEKIGFVGKEDVGRIKPHAYMECHIEQGPILRSRGLDIGVVMGVQAIGWREVAIVGRAAHAGTTPMGFRRDAGVAASKVNLKLREMTESGRYGVDMRATVGAWKVHPGMVNVVPSRVIFSVDLRNPSDAFMKKAEDDLTAYLKALEKEDEVQISWRQTAKTPLVPFDKSVQELIGNTANDLRLTSEPILSGAGHDAQEWSRICKTAMVFVPGEYDGISHNPREFSTRKQCTDGINVLLNAALRLSEDL
jgi:N-carbamoyl-L-amino-acid hydrolase